MISYTASEIAADMAMQSERIILTQLNELVKRGLLEVQSTQPILVWSEDFRSPTAKLEMRQAVKLLLKDQEYIEKLEQENSALKRSLNDIKQAVSLTFSKDGKEAK